MDRILALIKSTKLGIWNSPKARITATKDGKDITSTHFFEYPIKQAYLEVKTFYSNIKTIKSRFASEFDNNF
jgi:hypothetical protein